jgi:hypothetical protein
MRMARISFLLLTAWLLLFGCSLFNPDRVQIDIVAPNSGLVDGQWYTFTVEARYKLVSAEQGVLSVGFNNGDSADSYPMISSADIIVAEGSGQHTFSAYAAAKRRVGSPPFQVTVTLDEFPPPSGLHQVLASDKEELYF